MIPANIRALIMDMDGVIWKSDAPIGDLPAIFRRIEELGLSYVFATNNSTKTSKEYADTLLGLGVKTKAEQVITSSTATAHMLTEKFPKGAAIFAIGESGLREALSEKGFKLLSVDSAVDAQAVVLGVDREINFEKMREATLLVRNGIPFYATNPDVTFPTPRGEIPGNGAWASVIISATNVQPIYAGKPSPYMMELALSQLGTTREESLVIGDRIETDIAAGQAMGCPTALVLSGVSTSQQALAWRPPPDLIVQDLTELVN